MEKVPAKIWIEYNPQTGKIKPWEVCFKAVDGRKWVSASCATEKAAERSIAKTLRINEMYPFYEITRVAAR